MSDQCGTGEARRNEKKITAPQKNNYNDRSV